MDRTGCSQLFVESRPTFVFLNFCQVILLSVFWQKIVDFCGQNFVFKTQHISFLCSVVIITMHRV